ncbi:MAG: Hsp20/alpha crystallin family protein [Thermofilum sp.]|nr:Hsp20/alpha crystallin family protein [Thermofilum sp.]
MYEFDEWLRRTRRLFEEFDKLFEELMKESFEPLESGKRRVIGPFYYGFSVTIGPDGVPRIREWGNIRPGLGARPRISEAVEPFVDVIEEEDVVKVIADVPGVEKEDINVEATETEVKIYAERGERKYFKIVKLPTRVRPETAKASYRNGVLTITIEKVEKEKKPSGVKVKIE